MLSSAPCRLQLAKAGARPAWDLPVWLLATRMAGHSFRDAPPSSKQRALFAAALTKLAAAAPEQMLSQALLQLVLLANCVPSSKDLQAGTQEACAFVKRLVEATNATAAESPGELVLAEVQLSFVLTSVPLQYISLGKCHGLGKVDAAYVGDAQTHTYM